MHFNSLAVADADGTIVGHYRKSHIPDGPGWVPALASCSARSLWQEEGSGGLAGPWPPAS